MRPEGGPFVDNRYERLGAVGVLKVDVDTPFQGVRYRFKLFENAHALAAVVVPPEIATGYSRYNSSGRVA